MHMTIQMSHCPLASTSTATPRSTHRSTAALPRNPSTPRKVPPHPHGAGALRTPPSQRAFYAQPLFHGDHDHSQAGRSRDRHRRLARRPRPGRARRAPRLRRLQPRLGRARRVERPPRPPPQRLPHKPLRNRPPPRTLCHPSPHTLCHPSSYIP